MHSLESPGAPPRRTGIWLVIGAAILAAIGAVVLYQREPARPSPWANGSTDAAPPSASADTPTTANAPAPPTERTSDTTTRTGRSDRPAPAAPKAPSAPAAPAPPARELRVNADVDGAYVFLDRKFLGSTPLVSRDVPPGSHQLNVQVAGRPPQVQTIEVLADRPTVIDVTLSAAAVTASLDASVAVVHQHGMGSCEGTLRATGDTLRYDTAHKDAFSVALASLDQFSIDYQEKRLRVKARSRTWNFTTRAATADPLFVFHRDVEAARAK